MIKSLNRNFLKRNWLAYLVLPIFVVIFINLKMFLISGCFPFDFNDDANLTFPKLRVAWDHIVHGRLPIMNLFDNFGTPLLGDNLTFLFSPHSLTYLFFPGYIAMAINRSVIAFLCIVLLTKYFRKFFSLFISSVCALLVFFSPGVFWTFAHHHFQVALLDIVILLLLQTNYTEKHSFFNLSCLFFGFVLLFLSTSINLVFIVILFLAFNQWFVSQRCQSTFIKDSLLLGLTVIAALIFSYPQMLYFFKLIKISARLDYQYGVPYTIGGLIAGILGPANSGHLYRHHTDAAIFLSFPLLVMILLGLVSFVGEGIRKNIIANQSIILGIIPLMAVYLLLYFRKIWWWIPLVRATDITRIWWISHIFLMLSAGKALDSVRRKKDYFYIVFISLATILGFIFLVSSAFGHLYKWGVVLFLVALWYNFLFKSKTGRLLSYSGGYILGISLLVAFLPSPIYISGLNAPFICHYGHFYSPKWSFFSNHKNF